MENNTIKLKDLQKEIIKVFKLGYENTIELKINGEYYKIVRD